MSCLRLKNHKKRRKKGSERKIRKRAEVAVQRHRNHGLMTKKPRSEDVTSIIPKTRPNVIRRSAKTFGKN
ncbi:hypothetical protein R6Q57_014168 [Mikania cordata]